METLSSLALSPSHREDRHHHHHHHVLIPCSPPLDSSNGEVAAAAAGAGVGAGAGAGVRAMKKRKKPSNGSKRGVAVSGRIITTLLHNLWRRRLLHPLFSAVSAFVLLLFAASSLPIIHHRRSYSFAGNEIEVRSESGTEPEKAFAVPASGGSLGRDLWVSRLSKLYHGCSNASDSFARADVKTHPNRYLLIATSGGLNQQRTGITDSVVAAYILNATLVVPKLDQKSFWKDNSDFAEIFDVDQFISFLSKDVKIIKELPSNGRKTLTPYTMRVPRKCNPKCYESRVLPVLNKKHAVRLTKFDYRLSNKLNADLQRLRCRVNYHALKFTDPILEMGKKLVQRMRMKIEHFIALHLRFEPDMLAFSGCYYGGGDKERAELGAIRKRWKTLHKSNPEKVRRHGRCPLTPEEVGLMLRALGFGSDAHIYVASGEVYGGEETLAPLKALFPNYHSKETIASNEELAAFSSFSSRMAALDFIVCDESDVFVTNNNGNMARMLAGRRRYFGHKPTIRPNAKKLYRLFLTRNNMTWEEFASRVRTDQIGFMGEPNEVKPGRGEFHENPASCICEKSKAKAKAREFLTPQNQTHSRNKSGKVYSRNNEQDEQSTVDEQEWSEMDYSENGMEVLPNGTESDPDLLTKTEQPELEEELFSD